MPIHSYRTAIVTGAASGIGAACVRMLRGAGLSVLAIDKDEGALARIAAEAGCEALALDLRNTGKIYEALGRSGCDILINNAGLAHDLSAGFMGARAEQVDEMIAVNMAAAIHVIRAILPGMEGRNRGHIVEMGSIAGLYPLGLPVYSATKGAIHAFSGALRMELIGKGIRHTEICPGRTETGFFDSAFPDAPARERFTSQLKMLEPDDIAMAIRFALEAPLHMNVGLIELTPVSQAPGGQVLNERDTTYADR